MKKGLFTVMENVSVADRVLRMTLAGDTSAIVRPGQFVNVEIEGLYLRRPLSVCDWDAGKVVLVYKVIGVGTQKLSRLRPGAALDLLTGLGNGFDVGASGARPLLVGGGVGVPPLYGLARRLLAADKRPVAALGFGAAREAILVDEMRALGVETHVATLDGSMGAKGLVTDLFPALGETTYFYACGPEPMLRAAEAALPTDGEMSFEERMGCGFGACMGCSCRTKGGSRRVCKDGPVFKKGEVLA